MKSYKKKREKVAPVPKPAEPELFTSTGLFFYENMNRAGDDALKLCAKALNICDGAIAICKGLNLSSSPPNADPHLDGPPKKRAKLN